MRMKYQNIEFTKEIYDRGKAVLTRIGGDYLNVEYVKIRWRDEPSGGWIHDSSNIRWSTEELLLLYKPFGWANRLIENNF